MDPKLSQTADSVACKEVSSASMGPVGNQLCRPEARRNAAPLELENRGRRSSESSRAKSGKGEGRKRERKGGNEIQERERARGRSTAHRCTSNRCMAALARSGRPKSEEITCRQQIEEIEAHTSYLSSDPWMLPQSTDSRHVLSSAAERNSAGSKALQQDNDSDLALAPTRFQIHTPSQHGGELKASVDLTCPSQHIWGSPLSQRPAISKSCRPSAAQS